jgi:hypothetical protein
VITSGRNPDDVLKLWDAATGQEMVTLPGEPGYMYNHLGSSPDGNVLYANSFEGITLLWRAPSWEEIEAKENAP